MILDSDTKVVRAYLAGAPSANQPEWNVVWADHNATERTFTPGHDSGLLTGSTPAELVGSPTDGTQRQVKLISIFNGDTAGVTVTVDVYDGSDARRWIKAVLAPDWTLAWEPGGTWYVYDDNGVIQGMAGTTTASLTVEEQDGSPSYTAVSKIQFDQSDGFVVSQPSSGIARVDFSGAAGSDEEARLLAFWKLFNRGF